MKRGQEPRRPTDVGQGWTDVERRWTDVERGWTDVERGWTDLERGWTDVERGAPSSHPSPARGEGARAPLRPKGEWSGDGGMTKGLS